jgi:tripartite-type tricarboxylate transporter receptor subunit TctC
MNVKLNRRQSLIGIASALSMSGSWAQNYPSQPIKVIMPFSPGTGSENVLRVVLDRLSEKIKQPFVLDNRPGAGSTLGTDQAARMPPDGYNLVATYNSSIAPGSLLYSKLGYDPIKDFKHIALVGVFPQFMVVRADSPAKTVQDFIAMARAKPGVLNYSSAGVGTSGFLAGELLKQTLKIDMVHVAYKGPSQGLTDLLGGRLDMMMTASAASLVAAGKLRILAATSEKRSPLYPDVPALSEVAPGVSAVSWVGISAPAATPAAITQQLERAILSTLAEPAIRARLADPVFGIEITPLGSADFLEFIKKELRIWAPVIKAGNMQIS